MLQTGLRGRLGTTQVQGIQELGIAVVPQGVLPYLFVNHTKIGGWVWPSSVSFIGWKQNLIPPMRNVPPSKWAYRGLLLFVALSEKPAQGGSQWVMMMMTMTKVCQMFRTM